MRTDKRASSRADKKAPSRASRRGVVGYSKKSALLEEAITHMNTGKYGRSSAALKELLALDPHNTEARRLFATLHLRLGSLVTARQAFESLANEAIGRQDYWLAESLLREYLAAGPRCVPFLELLAHVNLEKGDEMAAVGELGKAIEILRDESDPESHQKAAQLYAKIRELAPGSSVAMQLASLFDVQTGQIIFRAATEEVPPPTEERAVASEPDVMPVTTEDSLPEIMPWEQVEESESIATVESPTASDSLTGERSKFDAPTEAAGPAEAGKSESSLSAQGPQVPILESNPLNQSSTLSELELPPHHEEATGEGLGQHLPLSAAEVDQAWSPSVGNEEVRQPSLDISETPSSLSSTIEPIPDSKLIASDVDTEPASDPVPAQPYHGETTEAEVPTFVGPSSNANLPAASNPMPWEQIADATLEIPKPESSDESTLTIESSQSDVKENTGVPLPYQFFGAGSPPVLDPTDAPPEVNQDVATDPPSATATPQEAELPVESTTNQPSESSFSWTSVFDSAWKFAAGTLGPNTTSPASDQAQEVDVDCSQAASVREPESSSTNPVNPGLDAPLAMELQESTEAPLLDQVSHSSDQTSQAMEESTISTEAPPELDSLRSSNVVDNAPSNPIPEESATVDLPEFPDRSISDEATSMPIESGIPVSFSTVLDAQEIPETEPAPDIEPEQPNVIENEVTEPFPERFSQDAIQAEGLPATGEPLQAIDEVAPHTADPAQTSESPAPPEEIPSHWSTGEVAVQLYRPSAKRKKWEKEQEESTSDPAPSAPGLEKLSEKLSEAIREWESAPEEATVPPVAEEVAPPLSDTRPEWMQASAGITFRQAPIAPHEAWQNSSSDSAARSQRDSTSAEFPVFPESRHVTPAASAVDVLFGSTGQSRHSGTQDRFAMPKPRPRMLARLHRIRIGVSSFLGTCFSTTRSLTILAMAIGVTTAVVAALGIGGLAVTWMAMEQPPSALYQKLTGAPPRVVTDSNKNGYFMLLGFDAPVGQDPIEAGKARTVDEHHTAVAQACMGEETATAGGPSVGASGHVVKGWFRSTDPVGQLKIQGDAIRSMAAQEASSITRYRQWLGMPFDDWGYGQPISPNCTQILLAHRLFVLEGFGQDSTTGLDQLESDARAWRTALAQSKTLSMKMLALTALQDDVDIASGLLSGSELDGNSVTRLSKVVRPLDQVELSLRWPMQSELAWATRSVPAKLRDDKSVDRPWYASFVAGMRLPIQRSANAYAEYYEEVNKAVAAGRYSNLPKPSGFIQTPATGAMDYISNPVEHIVGIQPPPAWDPYVWRVMETDARLRLVGLQAWIRRGPQEGDLLTRLAKAGQAYFDPFTGLPMLMNQRKGLIYSVGRDGKDQEGDRASDIAVMVPSLRTPPSKDK